MKIKSIRQIKNLKDQIVLLRVDFNVPIKDRKVRENYKIAMSLPTIEYLLKKGARVVLMSHLGAPKGKVNSDLSLLPVSKVLQKLLSICNLYN